MLKRNWTACDFVFISGDAYADHPSFGTAVIARVLEHAGFAVGIIPQPDWKDPKSYTILGRPRLAFLVSAGNMDSMVSRYTAAKKIRSEDAYSPGGKPGKRPDRAILKYAEGVRSAYKDIPVIIGGIEASLRRFAHYDYWSDTVRRSILLDSKADILVYGMGERSILEIAGRLGKGESVSSIRNVRGTCVRSQGRPAGNFAELPAYGAVKGTDPESLRRYAEHFTLQRRHADPGTAQALAEPSDGDRWVLQNPPAMPLSPAELDAVYELPYMRRAHPVHEAEGGIPALQEVAFSLTAGRGCFGGCSFCAITFHQGRAVTGRTAASLLREAEALTESPDFKGYIHDVGGPTANFFRPPCARQAAGSFCPDRECLYPEVCPNVQADHREYWETLKALREALPAIKKVFIRSGIRYDYLMMDSRHYRRFLEDLCRNHVSGQLKTAPEHVSAPVLDAMGKGQPGLYERFTRDFAETNRRLRLKQYLLPYFMSGHPGSALESAVELALYLKKSRFTPDQAQDFYPTPGTLSTAMYRTGLDPRSMQTMHIPLGKEKKLQRVLLHFSKPAQRSAGAEALRLAAREDLIPYLLK
jgi:uncharacterized radical SAM protein YgiQ